MNFAVSNDTAVRSARRLAPPPPRARRPPTSLIAISIVCCQSALFCPLYAAKPGKLTPEEFAKRGIQELPRTLDEAVQAFAADPFVTKVLGQGLRDEFIAYKSEEWRQYHQQVSTWEIERYARMF